MDKPTDSTSWIGDKRRQTRKVAAWVLMAIGCAALALYLLNFLGRVLIELMSIPWQIYVFIFLPLALVWVAHHLEPPPTVTFNRHPPKVSK